jgi:plasmid stabilization system protein ParE
MLPQSGFSGLIQKAEKMLTDEAFDPSQHPRTQAALNRLYEEGSRPGIQGFSPQGAEVVRRHLMNAEEAAIGDIKNPAVGGSADSRLAGKLLDDFDDFMDEQLAQAGPEYRNARTLWSTQLKSAEIERLFERAKNQAGQFSISGMDNALRTQFKQLADNPRRLRRFNEAEREAILKVARGDASQYTLTLLGKLAPTGNIPLISLYTAESTAPGSGYILGATGIAAKLGATALRKSRARAVDELVRSRAIPAMGPSRLPGSQPLPQTGYLPAATLGTNEADQERMRMISTILGR